jgi:hypothetical protein
MMDIVVQLLGRGLSRLNLWENDEKYTIIAELNYKTFEKNKNDVFNCFLRHVFFLFSILQSV